MIPSTTQGEHRSASSRIEPVLMAVLAVLAVAFWHWDVMSVSASLPTFAGYDLFTEFFPRHHYAGQALRAGHLPLWDPTQAAGLPFAATWQAGFFYPPNLLYGLLPTGLAMGILARVHLFLCGLFAFRLGREASLSRGAAMLTAVTYMLCGSTVFMMYHTCAMSAAPWLPASLLFASRLGRRPGATTAAALAVSLALLFLAGRDFALVMTLHAVALLTLFQFALRLREPGGLRTNARHFGLLVVAGALTIGLVAVQALPTLDLAARSGRTVGGLPPAMLEPFGAMPPSFFLANLVNPLRGPIRREYLGWIPLVCALVGMMEVRRSRAVAYFTVLALASLLLVFGSQTPAYAIYSHLPLASVFRLPDRFVLLFSIAMAMLAGFGLDRLLEPRDSRRPFPVAGLAAAGTFCAFVVWAGTSDRLLAAVAQSARPWGWFPFYGFPIEQFGGFHAAAAGAAAAFAAIAGAGALAKRAGAGNVKALLVALTALDLLFAFRSISPHPESGVAQATSASACYEKVQPWLRDHGRHLSLRLPDSYALKDKDGELFGTLSATHYDPLVTRRHAAYFALLQQGGTPIVDSPWNSSSAFMGMLFSGPAPARMKLLDLLGVRAILVDGRSPLRPRAFDPLVARYPQQDSCVADGANGPVPVALLQNPHAIARASILFDAVNVKDLDAAVDALGRADLDPSRSIVVEAGAEPLPPMAGSDGEATATIAEYSENRVVVDVNTRAAGVLLLTDTWDPEWTATVDGRSAEILPADVLFRGVVLRADDRRVVFEYRPTHFRVGALLSLLSLLAAGAWVLLARRRESRP